MGQHDLALSMFVPHSGGVVVDLHVEEFGGELIEGEIPIFF